MPSGTLFSARSRFCVSFSLSFALTGRVEAENWSPQGLWRASKIIQNRLKITLDPHWWTKACRGVPPGCLQDTQGTYLCIFMHVFIRMHAYSCIFMHVYAKIYAYSCIFMHIYAYFMHASCMLHAYVCIFMHIIHAYVWLSGNTYTLGMELCTIGLNLNCL